MLRESTDERVLWRVRRTVYQMLRDRGYEISENDIEETFEEFLVNYASKPNLSFVARRPDPDMLKDLEEAAAQNGEAMEIDQKAMTYEPIYVGFLTKEEKLSKEQINKVLHFMNNYSNQHKDEEANLKSLEHAILIVKGGVTTIGKKFAESYNPFVIEMFIQEELLINVTHHELVPKHTVLTTHEKSELLKRYRAKEGQLPKIQCEDPIARYFGVRRGQVMKIVRPSETAGRYVTYRLAV